MEHRERGLLSFSHEKPPLELRVGGRTFEIKPDFTVYVGDRKYYWEHLGMLDLRDYSENWRLRRKAYEDNGFGDVLITTDDLNGVRQECLNQVVEDILNGNLNVTGGNPYSNHHYTLWESQ
jgi:hypothetical protein